MNDDGARSVRCPAGVWGLSWTLLLASGCAGVEPPTARFSEGRDSAGVAFVETHRLAWDTLLPLPVSEPTAAIFGEHPAVVIGSVVAATRLGSGNIVIADGQGRRLLEFTALGDFKRALGQPGEGPGEFLSLRTVSTLPGDTLAVYDPRLRRLSFFPPGDGPPQVVTLPTDVVSARAPMEVWALGENRVLALIGGSLHAASERAPSGPTVFGPPAVVRLVSLRDGVSEQVFEGGHASESIQDGTRFSLPAFGRAVHMAVAGGRQAVLTTSESHSVLRFDSASWVVSMRSAFPSADHPITSAELSRLKGEARAAAIESGSPLGAPDFLFEPQLQPPLRPAFSDLLLAPNGFVLAREFAPLRERSAVWWVLGPEGSFRGRIVAPGRGDLLEIGDRHIIVVVHDEYDVPTVEVRSIAWENLPGGTSGSPEDG